MIRIPRITVEDFKYLLPEEKIAQFPLARRDASKLLIWKDGAVSEGVFSGIGDHLPGKSTLVFNDTKVIRARLFFTKPTGAAIEIFCLDPVSPIRDIQASFSRKESSTWECLIGNVKRWRSGILEKRIGSGSSVYWLSARKKENLGNGCYVIEFTWKPGILSFSEILELAGSVPLPPYIHRMADKKDESTYQTVYAENQGSVAAPTAGLHFTGQLIRDLEKKEIFCKHITLHVGLGTFRPVSSPEISGHVMHAERISVPLSVLEHLLQNADMPVIAVGTTSVRTLESLYWLGVKYIVDKDPECSVISQWDPYHDKYNAGITLMESFTEVMKVLKEKGLDHFSGTTQVMIMPGYEFKVISGIITNFHLPGSTLLMLIAAFTGDSWKMMYDYALGHDFRFLSYGDASILIKSK